MILSDNDIREQLKKGAMKIKPLEDAQVGPASIDLTLSDEWYFFKEELLNDTIDLKKTGFQDSHTVRKSESIILRPGEMCLAKTVEKITLPDNIMGKLEGRSRFARMGLVIHLTSALVQPGSDNHQVLEVMNLAPFPVKLHAGMRISQVLFEKLETGTSRPYSKFGEIAKDQ